MQHQGTEEPDLAALDTAWCSSNNSRARIKSVQRELEIFASLKGEECGQCLAPVVDANWYGQHPMPASNISFASVVLDLKAHFTTMTALRSIHLFLRRHHGP